MKNYQSILLTAILMASSTPSVQAGSTARLESSAPGATLIIEGDNDVNNITVALEAAEITGGFPDGYHVEDKNGIVAGPNCIQHSPTKAICGFGRPLKIIARLRDGNDIMNAVPFFGGFIDDPFMTVDGGAGDDTINGNRRDDVLIGGSGNDTINGKEGSDTINGGSGNDNLSGNSGNDTMKGEAGKDNMDGNEGDDVISGGIDPDNIRGGAGKDTIKADVGNDTVNGNEGDDHIFGGSGSDNLRGGTGKDTIHADADNDLVTNDDNEVDNFFCGTGRDRVNLGKSVSPNNDVIAADCEDLF